MIYFSGDPSVSPRNMAGSTVLPVFTNLEIFSCIMGGHLPRVFTLLPRKWVAEVFSSGPSYPEYHRAFVSVLAEHKELNPRGKKRVPLYESGTRKSYFTAGNAPSRNTKGLVPVFRNLPFLEQQRSVIDKFFAKIEHLSMGYIDSKSLAALAFSKKVSGYSGYSFADGRQSSIWSSIAFAENVAMNAHRDDDFFLGVVCVVQEDALIVDGNDVCQYFCFPDQGKAVALKNGDVLLFNPKEKHCISGRTNVGKSVVCASLYLKTAVVGGNDNSRTVRDLKRNLA